MSFKLATELRTELRVKRLPMSLQMLRLTQ
jgi:hypothetical protein